MMDARRERRVRWAVRLGGALLSALGRTWRFEVRGDAGWRALRAEGRPFVFAPWHGELLPLVWRHRGEGVRLLISEHADGEIIARICERLGFGTVRGSSSRGAARALLGITSVLESGHELAVTPDGPRGPARQVQPGVLVAAQRAGAPVVPIGVAASSGWRLRSWDRFLVPKPFARVTVVYGAPQSVPAADGRAAAGQGPWLESLMAEAAADAAP